MSDVIIPILEKVNGIYLGYLTAVSFISDNLTPNATSNQNLEFMLMSANLICSVTKYLSTHSSLPISLEVVYATSISKLLQHLNGLPTKSLPDVFQDISSNLYYVRNPVEVFHRVYFSKGLPAPLDDDFIYSHCLLLGTLRNTKEMMTITELVSRMLNVSTCSVACCMTLNLFIHYTLFVNEGGYKPLTQNQILDTVVKTAKNFIGDKYKGAYMRYAYMSFEGLQLEKYNADHSLKVMGVGLWAVRELQRQLENTFGANGKTIEEKYYSILGQIADACGPSAEPKYVLNYVGAAGALMGIRIGNKGLPKYIFEKHPKLYSQAIKIVS